MSKIRIDQVGGQGAQQVQADTEVARRRRELHRHSEFQARGPETFAGIGQPDLSALKGRSDPAPASVEAEPLVYRLPDGQELEIPQLSLDMRERAQAIIARMGPTDRERVEAAIRALGGAVWDEVESPGAGLRIEACSSGLSNMANQAYETYAATNGEREQNQVTEDLLVLGLSGVEQNLYGFFDIFHSIKK